MQIHHSFRGAAMALTLALVAGCGQPSATTGAGTSPLLKASSTQALKAGFSRVHQVIFDRLDANQDARIDEYEAGPTIPLNLFSRLDRNGDGLITQAQFIQFATAGGFFTGADTEDRFFVRMRDYLGTAFQKFDRPTGGMFSRGDGFLSREELSDEAMAKVGLGFRYPTLNLSTTLVTLTDDLYFAADKTGDGRLSQAEFEDLYMDMVVVALGSH